MEQHVEITMLKLQLANAEQRAELWEGLAKAELSHHNRTKEEVYSRLGWAVERENIHGEISEYALSVGAFKSLCEAVDWGVV